MANAIEIALKAIDQASAVIKQVTNATDKLEESTENSGKAASKTNFSFTELNSAIQIGQQVIQALGDAYDGTVGKFVKYAGEVDSLSNITGESSEKTSRLIQVTNLYGLSIEQLTLAQKKLAQQGQSLSQETLVSLATQYQKLTTGQDRQLFLTKNLGRASTEWGEILGQNTESLKEQYATVSEGLILTEKQIAQAEELEVNQTILKNSWKSIGVTLGEIVSPAVTKLTREMNIQTAAYDIQTAQGKTYFAFLGILTPKLREMAEAQVDAQNRQAVAMQEATDSIEEQQAAFDALSATYTTQIGLMQTLQSEDDSFTKKQGDLNQKIAETTQQIAEAIIKFGENSTEVQGLQADYQNLSAQYAQNATDHENATKKIVYQNLLAKLSVDGISDAEFAMAQQMGVTLGIFTQANADEAIALNTLTTAVADGTISQGEFSDAVNGGASAVQNLANQLNLMPKEVNTRVTIETVHLGKTGISDTNQHANGGMFEIPSSYGNEGFRLGNGDTASAGEGVAIIPKNQMNGNNNDALMNMLRSLPRTIAHEIRQLEKYG